MFSSWFVEKVVRFILVFSSETVLSIYFSGEININDYIWKLVEYLGSDINLNV